AIFNFFGILLICFLFTFFLEFTLGMPFEPNRIEEFGRKKNEIIQGIILGSLFIGLGSIITFISIKEKRILNNKFKRDLWKNLK
ncbi:MAG: hypothetical protein QW140_01090, partial [Candidatus Aenigmatarchaeota archaeon]